MKRMSPLFLLLVATPLAAQQNALVGTWKVTYVAGVRMENGEATPINANGVLTVEAKGDSLIGVLVGEPVAGRPARPPLRLAGRSGAAPVRFLSEGKATLSQNGADREATVHTTWTLSVAGDSLSGTLERVIEGVDMPSTGPQTIRGSRSAS